jgi:hypothetical protein
MTDQAIASVIKALAVATSGAFPLHGSRQTGCFPVRFIPVTRVTLYSDAAQ